MSKEVTIFITSCGRPKLLRRTIESFVKYNTYPIKEVILCEDSGVKGIVDFAKDIFPYPVIFCYNDVRSGQMKTIERYTPLIKTPYVFHLEDDYEFFDYGFIELSFKIMDSDKKIQALQEQILALEERILVLEREKNTRNPLEIASIFEAKNTYLRRLFSLNDDFNESQPIDLSKKINIERAFKLAQKNIDKNGYLIHKGNNLA